MMEGQQNNQVDKLFREALQSAKDQPSTALWRKIASDLDQEDRQYALKRKQRHLIYAAALLLLMTGLGVIYNKMAGTRLSSLAEKSKPASRNAQTKIERIKTANPITQMAWSAKSVKRNNKTLTRFEASPYINLPETKALPASVNDEDPLKLTTVQKPEYDMDIIQTNSIQFFPQPVNSENMLVRPGSKSTISKLSFTTFFSQEFAGYNLSDNDATAADGREIEKRERNAFSASLGFYLNYRINRKWVVQSGLSYSWSTGNIDSAKSYAVKDNSGNVQFKMNTISGYGYLQYPPAIPPVVGDSVLTDKAYSRIHYLTVPIIVSYRIPFKRFGLLVGLGISFNLLTSATLETKIYGPNIMEQETMVPIKGLKSFNYGIIFKADLEYYINNRLGVNLIPSFKNSLSPVNIHSALSAYPYNFGIGAGISYHF